MRLGHPAGWVGGCLCMCVCVNGWVGGCVISMHFLHFALESGKMLTNKTSSSRSEFVTIETVMHFLMRMFY